MMQLRNNITNMNLVFKRESNRFVARLDDGQEVFLTKIIVKTEVRLKMLSMDLTEYYEYIPCSYYEMDDFDLSILPDKDAIVRELKLQLKMYLTETDDDYQIFRVSRFTNKVIHKLNLEISIPNPIFTTKKLVCVPFLAMKL